MGCGQTKSKGKGPTGSPIPKDSSSSSKNSGARSTKEDPKGEKKKEQGPESSKAFGDKSTWNVMGKYTMNMGKDDMMGEGTSSICRKGTNNKSNEQVAIKVYKSKKEGQKHEDVKMLKFKRQIQVLTDLQEPFVVPADTRYWNEQLAHAKPAKLFMSLLDYSKDSTGEPGADPTDGILYVVTELAQYSLKDYLALRRDQCRPLPKDSVRHITKAIIQIMAGLHAKGLVHIDFKPENVMMFNGRLKLIDVDGCVKVGDSVSIQDSSISFSPCYCAPEWAKFLIEDSEARICVSPALDVWSVGMTICELVTLDAVLKPMYANFLRNGHSHREAGFLFMDWLSSIKKAPLPKSVEKFDSEFTELLVNWLLVCDPAKRKTCAQSLLNPYVVSASKEGARMSLGKDGSEKGGDDNAMGVDEQVARNIKDRNRGEDISSKAPIFKGTLYKLDTNGNTKDPVQWRRRDMWIASNGALCYFSIKDNKRLVLIDGAKLPGATIAKCDGGVKGMAFEIKIKSDDNDQETTYSFAVDTDQEYKDWLEKLKSTANMEDMIQTMQLGANMANELKLFKLNVKNRRLKVEKDDKDQFAPVFKAKLWKVKAEGDRMKPDDWFEREMWLSKNGSLVYWSKKEERELVYYTTDDVQKATFVQLPNTDSAKPWTFQVQLPQSNDVEFAPGEFAAETEEMRSTWIGEFKKFQER